METDNLDKRSKYLRSLVLDALRSNGGGHFGSSFSTIETLRVIYDSFLRFNPQNPEWIDRDRFILSKGHGCLALYAILADKGFYPVEEMKSFCKPRSRFGGHPERGKVPGVEASTGALGHGLPIAVGMALAIRLRNSSSRVVVLVGDGEMNEGSNWEAVMASAKHRLSNLTLIVDYNKVQSYGKTVDVLDLEPLEEKLESFGFRTGHVDGHSVSELENIFKALPLAKDAPTAIISHTVKGKGFPFAEGKSEWHHKSGMSDSDFSRMYEFLN